MIDNLPLNWPNKENSPELEAYFKQFGKKYYFTAEEINELRDSMNQMYGEFMANTDFIQAIDLSSPAPTLPGIYIPTQAGTYPNYGGLIVDLTNKISRIIWTGFVFRQQVVTIDVSGKADKSFLFDGQNKYNFNNDTRFYIGTSDGVLVPSATSSVSEKIAVVSGEVLYIFNRTGNTGVRFLDISNTPIKPLTVDGVARVSYTTQNLNDGIKAPLGAVWFQMTTEFSGTGNRANTVLTTSSTNSLTIKGELIKPSPELINIQNEVSRNTNDLVSVNSVVSTRVNKLESTNTPEVLPAALQTPNVFGVNVVNDTASPTASYIGKKRVLFNDNISNGGTCYRVIPIILGVKRPSIISVSFWVKKTEFLSIFNTSFSVWLSTRQYTVNPTLVLSGTPKMSSGNTSTITEFDTATFTMTKIAEVGDYVRIRNSFSSIMWKESFTGTEINYFFLFTGANFFQKTLEVVDFTILFNEDSQKDVIYNDPSGLFKSNVITLKGLQSENENTFNKLNSLQTSIEESNNSISTVIVINKQLYFSSPFSESMNIVYRLELARESSFTNNPNSNFGDVYLSAKLGNQTVYNTLLKQSGDDIAPVALSTSYIGANHGWNQAVALTKMGHGKTFSDIGSIYTNTASVQFVILRIVNENVIWITSKNQAVDGFTYTFVVPNGSLTYLSGGANTATISTYTTAGIGNLYPSVSPSNTEVFINGNSKIVIDGTYKCDFIDVRESYDVYDLPSILDKLIVNRPVGGYLSNVYFNSLGADKLFSHNITYRFQSNSTILINHNFRTFKKLSLSYLGFIQMEALTTGKLYIPKTLPISDGIKTFDFRLNENWTSAPNAALNMTSAYWENPLSPPDRLINSNSNVNIHIGYMTDRGVGLNRKDKLNNAINLFTSKKIYPHALDNITTLEANKSFSCVAFRNFQNATSNPSGRLNYSCIELDDIVWIFLDYNGAISDSIVPKSKWIGRKIEVYEKNDKIELLCDVVTNLIEVVSTASLSSYGYAVLKIIK